MAQRGRVRSASTRTRGTGARACNPASPLDGRGTRWLASLTEKTGFTVIDPVSR